MVWKVSLAAMDLMLYDKHMLLSRSMIDQPWIFGGCEAQLMSKPSTSLIDHYRREVLSHLTGEESLESTNKSTLCNEIQLPP